MNEMDEIAKRAQEIEELDRRLAEARQALDLSSWARENGIDLEKTLAAARRELPASEFARIEADVARELDAIEQGLNEARLAARGTAGTVQAAPRRPRFMA